MPAAARTNDPHTCPIVPPSPANPHVGGTISAAGAGNVNINNFPAAVMLDTCTCGAPGNMIAKGSATVLIGNKPAARVGDATSHGGQITVGSPDVNIGG
ncbi:MAG: PAAR domain-containing protein [Saprospiraceae bacterium]